MWKNKHTRDNEVMKLAFLAKSFGLLTVLLTKRY